MQQKNMPRGQRRALGAVPRALLLAAGAGLFSCFHARPAQAPSMAAFLRGAGAAAPGLLAGKAASCVHARGERLVARASPADALFQQGMQLMRTGLTSPQDMARAMRLVNEAAHGGCVQAQTCMGCFYADGVAGMPKDMNTAVLWLQRASEGGDADAMYNLGAIKLEGRGVPKDKRAAAKHFREAGDRGHEEAMRNLAMMLVKGDGIPQDMQLGAQWLVKAAQTGDDAEDLMRTIQKGNLDAESAIKIQKMVDELRVVNRDSPYTQPADGARVTKYDADV